MNQRGDMQEQLSAIREKISGDDAVQSNVPTDEGRPEDREESTEGEAPVGRENTAEGEGESQEIRTLQQLAKAIDADPEFLYGLEMALSDGAAPVKLGEIKDKLQEYERSKGEIDKTRAELEQERQNAIGWANAIGQQRRAIDEASSEAQFEMRAAEMDFGRINWEELKRLDPGRAALEQQNLMARYGAAKERLAQAQQAAYQIAQQTGAQAKQYHDQLLLANVPEWRDPKKANEEAAGIIDWAHQVYGFSDPELQEAIDWRHRDILRKAYKYDLLQKQTKDSTGKAPAQLTGGRSLKLGEAQKAKVKTLVNRARQTRTKPDQVAAAKAILDNAFGSRRR